MKETETVGGDEGERRRETESDIDQSGGEWDEAVSSALAPTANQHDRVSNLPLK